MTSQTPEEKCCDKCYSTYTTDDYPDHQTLDACINRNCKCHTPEVDTTEIEEVISRLHEEVNQLHIPHQIYYDQMTSDQKQVVLDVAMIVRHKYEVALLSQQQKYREELQKARQDWLQEEIVRLEKDFLKGDPMHDAHQFYQVIHFNEAIQTIIDRYLLELKSIAQN